MKRREFIGTTAAFASLAALPPLPSFGTPSTIKKIGTQLFWLGKLMEQDLEAGFKLLSDIGYQEVQLYGPYSFYTKEGWRIWNEISAPNLGYHGSGLFGRSPGEFSQLLKKNNLSATSLHSDLENLEVNMARYGELGDTIGIRSVVMPYITPDLRQNLDDFKKLADRFNRIGELAKREGLVFMYHNHGPGWVEMEGVVPARYLFDNTDPELVKLEMDIYWMVAADQDPVELLKTYPGRFASLHLADMKTLKRFSGDGSDFAEILELFPNYTQPGSGVLNIREIVDTAVNDGVRHFYLEQIPGKEEETALRKSFAYLSSI